MIGPRLPHALLGIVLPLAFGACITRALETSRVPAAATAGVTRHGFVDGELVLRLTPEGERAIASAVGKTPGTLRFGVPSLDRLNAKHRASAIVPLAGEPGAYRLVLAPDANVVRAAEEYGRDPLVTRAEPNYLLRIDRPAEAPEAVRTDVGPAPGRR